MKVKSLLLKIITCLFAGVAFIQAILYLGKLIPQSIWTPAIKTLAGFIFVIVPLIITIAYPFVWQQIERKSADRSNIVFAWLHFLMRFCFAFIISSYGFAKLLGLQFQKIYSVTDIPLREQSGTSLTWNYFGYSFVFVCIIASVQIIGSLLLLFKRTYIAGVLILLPVMINILCIDLLYKIDDGALLNSILLSTGIIYLLMLEYQSFISLFKNVQSHLPDTIEGKTFLKLLLRISVILLPFLATLSWKNAIKKQSPVTGIYNVEKMTINNIPFNFDSARINDSVLTRVYFETNNVCILQFNNVNRRITTHYVYNDKLSQLQGVFNNAGKTTMNFKLNQVRNGYIKLDGTLSKDGFNIILRKIE